VHRGFQGITKSDVENLLTFGEFAVETRTAKIFLPQNSSQIFTGRGPGQAFVLGFACFHSWGT
jgi:hypothetical protein